MSIGGRVIEKTTRVPLTEEELEEQGPDLPFCLVEVWRDFIKLGSDFSYETELVPYLNRTTDTRDEWIWKETMLLTLRAEVSNHHAEKMKESRKGRKGKGNKKDPEKPRGIGKGRRGDTVRYEGFEGVKQFQQQQQKEEAK